MAISLSVNLNKIALIRNSREGDYPNINEFALYAINAGAQGITVHPRPDQRHIRPSDVRRLATLTKQYEGVEFNIEGNPFAGPRGDYPGLVALVRETQAEQCTLVPDSNEQKTSDHGFDLKQDGKKLAPLIAEIKANSDTRISLFMDPDLEQIALAQEVGADRIELYTGPFAAAHARSESEGQDVYQAHLRAAKYASELGLGINAGHDLNLHNMMTYRHLPKLAEVSIGHALTVDALRIGFDNAIKAYLKICEQNQA